MKTKGIDSEPQQLPQPTSICPQCKRPSDCVGRCPSCGYKPGDWDKRERQQRTSNRSRFMNKQELELVATSEKLDILPPNQRKIIEYHYNNGRPRSPEEVGTKFGYSRERVLQIENTARQKIYEEMARGWLAKLQQRRPTQ